MRIASVVAGLLSAVIVAAHAAPIVSADVVLARDQFRDFYVGADDGFAMRDTNEAPPDSRRARHFADTLAADGHWTDIDYPGEARSGWPAAAHYTRMLAMVGVARAASTPPDERTVLLAATHRAFSFWIAHDFQCPNWWYNQIGTPKAIGTTALLLGDELTPEEYRYTTGTSLARFPISLTGQNKVWLAGNALMLGLLTDNKATIQSAITAIWSEIQVTTGEGIQPDFSFHQHGPQQQFGNYGMAFAVETARWARILRGTPWQLQADQLEVFRHYLLDGQNWVSWRGEMDISACGRQFMPNSPRSKTANIAQVMMQAATFDPTNAAAYKAFVARNRPAATNDLTGDRYFWRSDYLVHRRPDFAATLKMSSNRVIGAELVNSENLSGYHIADGALYLYRDGGEYDDIFPVWDWSRLPGITCADAPPPAYKTSSVPSDFVGGLSDGTDGIAVLYYARDGVQAKKAWFFAGDSIVCLGADIAGKAKAPIDTTLNQCLLHGAVRFDLGGQTGEMTIGQKMFQGVGSVEHDGWCYSVLEPSSVHLEAARVVGNWHRVFDNPEAPNDDVTKNVFTLWLEHGTKVNGGHYAYRVAPIGAKSAASILENSPLRQIVQISAEKIGLVFWKAGEATVRDGRRIAVDAPCLVMLTGKRVLIVDPTQKLNRIRLSVDGVSRWAALPQGPLAGTPAVLE